MRGRFRSSSTTCGMTLRSRPACDPVPEEVVEGLDPVARDHDLVHDVVLLERPKRENLVVLVVLDEQDGLVRSCRAP